MRYPEYASDTQARMPTRTFLHLVGKYHEEIDIEYVPAGDWMRQLAAQARHHAEGDRQKMRKGRDELRRLQVPAEHRVLLNTIRFGNRPDIMRSSQQEVHDIAIDNLQKLFDRKEDMPVGNFKGSLSEITAVALLSRYAHPNILVAPSLPFHDMGNSKKEMHYDVGLALADGPQETMHYLQVKSACMGKCHGVNWSRYYTPKYSPKVQFISGHCDLGVVDEKGAPKTRIPELLLAEYHDTASSQEIKELDVLTDTLLFNISADLLFRGTAASEA